MNMTKREHKAVIFDAGEPNKGNIDKNIDDTRHEVLLKAIEGLTKPAKM
jgi:hypothetical protein